MSSATPAWEQPYRGPSGKLLSVVHLEQPGCKSSQFLFWSLYIFPSLPFIALDHDSPHCHRIGLQPFTLILVFPTYSQVPQTLLSGAWDPLGHNSPHSIFIKGWKYHEAHKLVTRALLSWEKVSRTKQITLSGGPGTQPQAAKMAAKTLATSAQCIPVLQVLSTPLSFILTSSTLTSLFSLLQRLLLYSLCFSEFPVLF